MDGRRSRLTPPISQAAKEQGGVAASGGSYEALCTFGHSPSVLLRPEENMSGHTEENGVCSTNALELPANCQQTLRSSSGCSLNMLRSPRSDRDLCSLGSPNDRGGLQPLKSRSGCSLNTLDSPNVRGFSPSGHSLNLQGSTRGGLGNMHRSSISTSGYDPSMIGSLSSKSSAGSSDAAIGLKMMQTHPGNSLAVSNPQYQQMEHNQVIKSVKCKLSDIYNTVFLKRQCHEIFDLCFFFIKQSCLGPCFRPKIFSKIVAIRREISEYRMRCPALCRIAQDYGSALCRIALIFFTEFVLR
jgi:hypothetical protein